MTNRELIIATLYEDLDKEVEIKNYLGDVKMIPEPKWISFKDETPARGRKIIMCYITTDGIKHVMFTTRRTRNDGELEFEYYDSIPTFSYKVAWMYTDFLPECECEVK